jgi:rubrerythrin
MARIQGATNKPKSAAELKKLLADAEAREAAEAASKKGKAAAKKALPPTPAAQPRGKGGKFKALVPADQETYKCGICGETMDAMYAVCPKCGGKLQW